ncbi:MAG: hypothetical protein QOJ65_598 [Fimbriimonadaceae bacterium]|nr:hypothetical protein [Fimbriimonadaceae bacterium]
MRHAASVGLDRDRLGKRTTPPLHDHAVRRFRDVCNRPDLGKCIERHLHAILESQAIMPGREFGSQPSARLFKGLDQLGLGHALIEHLKHLREHRAVSFWKELFTLLSELEAVEWFSSAGPNARLMH